MSAWLVVHTKPNAEAQAEFHLRRQGYTVYVPKYRKTIRHARKTESVVRPLFPRYLFVEYHHEVTRWRAIQSSVGVCQLVFAGEAPLLARQEILREIMDREDNDGLIVLSHSEDFKSGQVVRVTEGPLCDHVGLFECKDDGNRAIILLDMLGRAVKTRIPLETLSVAS